MDVREDSDEALIARTKAGENDAFGILFDRYRERIARMIGRYGFQPADVEDITQRVFLKAFQGLPSFRGESRFYTWLYRIASNAALSHKDASARRYEVCWEDCDEFSSADIDIGWASFEDERRAVANQSIQSLPRGMKDAFSLHAFKGFDYKAVAAIIDCPLGTVRSRINRARNVVRSAVTGVAA